MGELVEQATHSAVALRRSVAVGLTSTLLAPRIDSHPRRELSCRWKRFCTRANLGDNLLCGIHPQAGQFRKADDGGFMCFHRIRDHPLQLSDLCFYQIQTLEIEPQQGSVRRLRLPAEDVLQLCISRMQALIP